MTSPGRRRPPLGVALGVRLLLATGRQGGLRAALTATGVAVGVALGLLVLTALPALEGREARLAWHHTRAATIPAASSAPCTAGGSDDVLWSATDDHVAGRTLFRVRVAALGPRPSVPPGLSTLPSAGEVAVSPALRDLLAWTPADELADRLGGRVTSIIGDAGLTGPDDLVAVTGRPVGELRAQDAPLVHAIETRPAHEVVGTGLRIAVTMGAAALLVPVLVFTVMSTRVFAARRQQRLVALRLVGATRLQTSVASAVEVGTAAVAGALAGWVGYLVVLPLVREGVRFDGMRFAPPDVAVPAGQLALVVAGVPLLAMASSVLALLRSSPDLVGGARGRGPRPPRAWRLLVPGLGLGSLAAGMALRGDGRLATNGAALRWGGAGSVVLLLAGAVVSGPWLCAAAARVLARRTRRMPGLLAARRIAADPYATFRAVAGVMLAVLVTTLLAAVAGANWTADGERNENAALRPGVVEVYSVGVPPDRVAALRSRLAASPDVRRVVVVGSSPARVAILEVSCADLRMIARVSCDGPGPVDLSGLPPLGLRGADRLAPAPPGSGLPVRAVYALVPAGAAAAERVRTLAATTLPAVPISTAADLDAADRRQTTELLTGIRLGTLFVLVVAAAGLTVGVLAGLVERRRPFALLRASGVPLADLRRVVLLEAALPLAVTAIVAAALGEAAGVILLRASHAAVHWPDPGQIVAGLGALTAALCLCALALPVLDSLTRYDTVRYE